MKTNSITNQTPFFDHCFDKGRLKKWITQIYYETIFTEDVTILNFVERLKTIGFREATRAGVSIGIDDLRIPAKKITLLREIEHEVENTSHEFSLDRLTALENFQSFIDTWHKTSEMIKMEVVANFEETDTLNPVYMMAFSGARGNLSQVTQLVGMRGFMSDPEGQIIDYPIRSNFREGLTLTEYVISCYGARKGLVDTALRTADAGYLTRRLVDVAHSVVITRFDCKTTQGIWLSSIQENSQTLYPLEKRLIGRVLAENIYFPYFDRDKGVQNIVSWSYFEKNQQIDVARAKLLASCFKRVLIRSPLRCLKKKRLCQLCYGWTLPHAHLAPIGEAVGILAAQSIGEPGTQLTMRTFHTGGVFSGALSDELKAPYSGIIHYNTPVNGALFRASNGQLAFRTKESGVLRIEPMNSLTKMPLFELNYPKASILFLKNLETVFKDDLLIELPKDNESSKETVLNTYTYYSKRSGLLKVYNTNLEPYKNYDLISHSKLPKIEPFYERAQYINRTFHSFKIYAGQISKTAQIQDILPKPGDLINTKSIVSSTQLSQLVSTNLELSKQRSPVSFEHKLPNVTIRKPIFRIPISNLRYLKEIGYLSQLKYPNFLTTIDFVIPSLTEIKKKADVNISLLAKEFRLVGRGNIFYPQVFSKLSQQKKTWEEIVYLKQLNNPPVQSIIHLAKFTNLVQYQSDQTFLNQSYFLLPESQYRIFQLKRKRQLKRIRVNKISKQKCGQMLSDFRKTKNSIIQEPLVSKGSANWVQQKTVLCKQTNLQQDARTAIANKDGFLIRKKVPTTKNQLLFTRNWMKTPNTIYWETQIQYYFKTGWPYFELTNKQCYKNHKKFHFVGQQIVSNISFPTKCLFTEYLIQSNIPLFAITKMQSKSKILVKKENRFKGLNKQFAMLIIQPTQEYSIVKLNTHNQIKTHKTILFKNTSLKQFKQIQNYPTQCFLKNQSLNALFNDINKSSSTVNQGDWVNRNAVPIKIKAFYENSFNQILFSKNSINSQLRFIHKKYYRSSGIQFFCKISKNPYYDNIRQSFKPKQSFTRDYAYEFSTALENQNYFKNGPWDWNSLYLPKPNTYSLELPSIFSNVPVIQSHFLSPHSGELVCSKSKSNNEIHSLILTTKDTCTIESKSSLRQLQVGDTVYYGLELTDGQSAPFGGQIIHITKTHLKLQLIENSLVASNSRFFCGNNQFIEKTSQIFTQSYPRLQMGDIVQGIPKIEEFFEARQTKEGVHFENNLHNRLKKRFRFYRKTCRYPLFIASRKSIYDIQNYIIDSIFKLYNSQGIDISDKHLEIIVRQMTSKVKVTQFWKYGTPFIPFKHPLPTELYSRHYIERYQYRKKNTRMYNVRYEPAVLGITRAALENDGFISAASFQETTRILSRGAIFQKKDYLKGLKENVILGHIIPAGTAVRTYSRRFKPPLMKQVLAQQALQVLTINHEWRFEVLDKTQISTQHFNPIRKNILKFICLEYFHII